MQYDKNIKWIEVYNLDKEVSLVFISVTFYCPISFTSTFEVAIW